MSLDNIRGCGTKTKRKLNDMNIFTCDELMKYDGPFNGIPINQLKSRIKEKMECKNIEKKPERKFEKKIITSHSWKNIVLHIVRSKNKITRVLVGDLVITQHSIQLIVTWRKNRKTYIRKISPLSLLYLHTIWTYNDIISENSTHETCDPVERSIPKFLIYGETNNFEHFKKSELVEVHNLVKEVNILRSCTF